MVEGVLRGRGVRVASLAKDEEGGRGGGLSKGAGKGKEKEAAWAKLSTGDWLDGEVDEEHDTESGRGSDTQAETERDDSTAEEALGKLKISE